MHRKLHNESAFTLIELLVVIAIIGLLSSIVLVNLQGTRQRGREAAGKQFSSSLQNALGSEAMGIWRLDEGSGTTVYDNAGYGNNGTLTNGPVWQTEAQCGLGLGSCLLFDGSDDYVNLDTDAMNGLNDFTVSYWMKTSDTTKAGTAIHATNTGNNEFIPYNYRSLQVYVKDTVWSTGEALNNGNWRFIAITRNGTTGKVELFVDGALEGSSTLAAGSLNVGGCLVLGQEQDAVCGGFDTTQAFLGLLDDVRIYATDLTLAKIQQLYAEGIQRHLAEQ
ncbi:MAG: LamG-like jellyroll fold domain-containing protein [bacterium]|nr:LamG-like jellyroll fold domain-containing protein [bacterium]